MILVLEPISTKDLTPADVDRLTESTRDTMLNTLMQMSQKNKAEVDGAHGKAKTTAIEI